MENIKISKVIIVIPEIEVEVPEIDDEFLKELEEEIKKSLEEEL